MERLLTLRLRSVGCTAEARVNDVPVGRILAGAAAGGGGLCVPVHEYVCEGDNELELIVAPVADGGVAAPRIADGAVGASLDLLLPRVGQPASEASARSLGRIEWAAAEGQLYTPPVTTRRVVQLPVKFPRWRWLDAPALAEASTLQPQVAAFVQSLAISLARGDPEPFAVAARLRFEDLAVAYGQPVSDLLARWRARIHLLHATKALRLELPALADVVLRPCGRARLLECVSPTGEPVLRTEALADGSRHCWPVRVVAVDDRCVILR